MYAVHKKSPTPPSPPAARPLVPPAAAAARRVLRPRRAAVPAQDQEPHRDSLPSLLAPQGWVGQRVEGAYIVGVRSKAAFRPGRALLAHSAGACGTARARGARRREGFTGGKVAPRGLTPNQPLTLTIYNVRCKNLKRFGHPCPYPAGDVFHLLLNLALALDARVWPAQDEETVEDLISLVHHVTGKGGGMRWAHSPLGAAAAPPTQPPPTLAIQPPDLVSNSPPPPISVWRPARHPHVRLLRGCGGGRGAQPAGGSGLHAPAARDWRVRACCCRGGVAALLYWHRRWRF